MTIHTLGGVLCLLLLMGACATEPLPGAVGTLSGPLRSIELYTKRTEQKESYPTAGRDRLFASDRELWAYLNWGLPAPGRHTAKVALRTPTGSLHEERDDPLEATQSLWVTWHRFTLPQGDAAQRLAGVWHVEAALDGTPVGSRPFTFDPSSVRLRTDAWIIILQGTDDPELATGDWTWRDQFGALERVKAAHAMLGFALRDELARRFPRVEGPPQQSGSAKATIVILVRTKFSISPNPDTDARLAVDVLAVDARRVPPETTRTFLFRSSAGVQTMGVSRYRSFSLAAADLAFQAATSPEVLEFLRTVTQAVPE